MHPSTTAEEDSLIEIADKANDRATARSRFFTIPIELRLQIYDHTLNNKDRTKVRITHDVCMYAGRSCSAVATLSRTCKQFHSEVTKIMYKDRRFDLHVSNSTVDCTCGNPP